MKYSFIARISVILISLLTGHFINTLQAQNQSSFTFYDSLTFALYSQNHWEELITAGEDALDKGMDYFFMRMRLGIAYYSLEQYRKASNHFRRALGFNSADTTAIRFLRESYLHSGLETEAANLNKKYQYDKVLPVISKFHLSSGYGISENRPNTRNLDLDGPQNIYGELVKSGDHYFVHLGIDYHPKRNLQWYGGYTFLQVSRNQKVTIGGKDTINTFFAIHQHQISARFPVKGVNVFRIVPNTDLILISSNPISVTYDKNSGKYEFSQLHVKTTQYSAGIELVGEFPKWTVGYSLSHSNFNNGSHWQNSLLFLHYPHSNLNTYAGCDYTFLLNEDGFHHNIRLIGGGKISSRLWAEGVLHFGELQNTRVFGSTIIYNTIGNISLKSDLTLYYTLSRNLTLLANFNSFQRKETFIRYTDYEKYQTKDFWFFTHGISGGLKWKL